MYLANRIPTWNLKQFLLWPRFQSQLLASCSWSLVWRCFLCENVSKCFVFLLNWWTIARGLEYLKLGTLQFLVKQRVFFCWELNEDLDVLHNSCQQVWVKPCFIGVKHQEKTTGECWPQQQILGANSSEMQSFSTTVDELNLRKSSWDRKIMKSQYVVISREILLTFTIPTGKTRIFSKQCGFSKTPPQDSGLFFTFCQL